MPYGAVVVGKPARIVEGNANAPETLPCRKNRIAVETLDILRKTGLFELSVCPVQSDSGIDTWQPSLKSFACNFNIPIVQIEDIYDENSLVFLSVEFDKIIESKNLRMHGY